MYENEEMFNEDTLQDALRELISLASYSLDIGWDDTSVRTFEEAGVLTYNKGLVITTPDGSEFQLTIVQSR